MTDNRTIAIEDAQIKFPNFAGKEGRFNPAGRRNFCVCLDPEIVDDLIKDGWNVRWLEPRNEGDERVPYIQVAVRFDNRPPKIIMISSNGKTAITEESVNILDFADLKSVDLIINGSSWSVNGKTGKKAYLKSMYVTIQEDEFEHKYFNAPDSAESAIGGCGMCEVCDGKCGSSHDGG